MRQNGKLLPEAKLKEHYRAFASRFGPERLTAVTGEPLLRLMHQRHSPNSLLHWLETKDDDEFAKGVGSIMTESATIYGLYQATSGGPWLKDGLGADQELSVREAVAIAEEQRDELLRGCELLRALPLDAGDVEYAKLEMEMGHIAHSVSSTAWGHRYFALIFPEQLDHFHSAAYQRFHLIKCLQLPPEERGRYACAGRFVALARALDVPMSHLTATLNFRNGRPHGYWRVWAVEDEGDKSSWQLMQARSCIAIGWPALGNLEWLLEEGADEDKLTQRLQQHYPTNPRAIGSARRQILNFVARARQGDFVVAADGRGNLGIGRLKGNYLFDAEAVFPHQRQVEWMNLETWLMPEAEVPRTAFWQLMNQNNLIAIERRLVGLSPAEEAPREHAALASPLVARIRAALQRKGQVILYGPPGTGKTHWALRAAFQLSTREEPPGKVEFCTFHAGFGYEDFIEGLRPAVMDGAMVYRMEDGVFKSFSAAAEEEPMRNFYLVIDEINRGDIPRIFGELMTVIEKNKRNLEVTLPLSKSRFSVPENVLIIGTMNTANRAAPALDPALRRRFAFIEVMPDAAVLGDAAVEGIRLASLMEALNRRILAQVTKDARNFQVGHSFFLRGEQPIGDFASLVEVLQNEVIPLLQKYCSDDFKALERMLGPGLIDAPGLAVHHEMFERPSWAKLSGLLREIAASAPAKQPAAARAAGAGSPVSA
ncbi:MAG: McrB family protein [Alphaproteobacteria bacterium]